MTAPGHVASFMVRGLTLATLRVEAERNIERLLGDEWGKVPYAYSLAVSPYRAVPADPIALWQADVTVVFG